MAVLEAIARWPLPVETLGDEVFEYLIGGEAFDWRLLAARLVRDAGDDALREEVEDWLQDPDPTGGFAEPEFTRLLGTDKYRSHLNYLYGVLIEKALVSAVEEEITKRRVASGISATERARDEAYERLYEGSPEELWKDFKEADQAPSRGRHGPRRTHLSLGDVDAFTYWLFKRRTQLLDPARIASDTRKGLLHMERMRLAHERRMRERLYDSVVSPLNTPPASNGSGPSRRYRRPVRRGAKS